MRLFAALAALLCAAIIPTGTAAAPKRSWAQPQIEEVVAAGLLAASAPAFQPEQPLTQ
ncbi:MAG: hypothetical protein H0V45_07685, partial [Actinobacteria bacterium]|nr:hypothetical protein [Actinomycetota bacterium]